MTHELQAAFESCGRNPELAERAEHRRVIREQCGVCVVCGVSLADHFTGSTNLKLNCSDPRVQAVRVQGVLSHALHGIGPAVPPSRADRSEGNRNPRRTR